MSDWLVHAAIWRGVLREFKIVVNLAASGRQGDLGKRGAAGDRELVIGNSTEQPLPNRHLPSFSPTSDVRPNHIACLFPIRQPDQNRPAWPW